MSSKLTGLNVYPVKSCRGMAVPRARVGARGLELGSASSPVGDRTWMIVDPHGRFITQRELARLALVEIELASDVLRLSMRGLPAFEVPLTRNSGATREVVVWQSTVPAHDAGDAIAEWLATALGIAARLVRYDERHERRCNPDFAGDSGAHTAFADSFPLLIAGEASLADLNKRLATSDCAALPMNRFRPNLVISGLPAYEEDHLDTIEVDGIVIKLVKPCTRCITTTTDQATAIRGVEPLSTLAGYRRNDALGGVTFGMNGIVTAGVGREIAVGSAAHCTYRF